MVTVGARLKALRDSIGLSQQKLGALCGLQQAAVNRYETDHSATPFRVLLWYADYFNVSLDYTQRRIDNMVTAIEEGILTSSTKERPDALEGAKQEITLAIAQEKLQSLVLTKE